MSNTTVVRSCNRSACMFSLELQPRRWAARSGPSPASCAEHHARFARNARQRRTETLFSLVLVMAAAPKLDIVHRRFTAICVRDNVMEFQEAGFDAATLFSLKCATPAVACPDFALDSRTECGASAFVRRGHAEVDRWRRTLFSRGHSAAASARDRISLKDRRQDTCDASDPARAAASRTSLATQCIALCSAPALEV